MDGTFVANFDADEFGLAKGVDGDKLAGYQLRLWYFSSVLLLFEVKNLDCFGALVHKDKLVIVDHVEAVAIEWNILHQLSSVGINMSDVSPVSNKIGFICGAKHKGVVESWAEIINYILLF